jgi:ferritin-like metal-binding protein YciE
MANTKTKPRKTSNDAEKDSMLQEFFHGEIKDIYWAEKHLLKTLPKMAKAATSSELKDAFTNHLQETKGHVERLEQIFGILELSRRQKNVMRWTALPKRVIAL